MNSFYPDTGTDLVPPILFPSIKTSWRLSCFQTNSNRSKNLVRSGRI